MSLKDKVRHGLTPATPGGFQLVRPPLHHFTAIEGMLTACKEQADNVTLIDASILENVDIDGRLIGSGKGADDDLRLSHAAFGDLCHFAKVPVSFIKRRAKLNEALALEVLRDCISHEFQYGADRQLVVDLRDHRIEGIVGAETYSPLGNAQVLDFAMTAMPGLEFTAGWLEGPRLRVSATSPEGTFESPVKVGDIVKFGVDVHNSINGDQSCSVADYNHRLKCTNGMIGRDKTHCEHIVHRGDVQFNVQSAVVRAAERAPVMASIMQKAASTLLQPSEVRALRAWLKDPKNGGNPSLDGKVVEAAMREAQYEGREEDEVTLWNFVNGITEAAHDTKSLNRRSELEAMGYRTLQRFGVALAN